MNKTISFTTKEESFPPGSAAIAHYDVWVNDGAKTQAIGGTVVSLDLVDGIYVAHVQAIDVNGVNVGAQVDSVSFTVVNPQPVNLLVPDTISVA